MEDKEESKYLDIKYSISICGGDIRGEEIIKESVKLKEDIDEDRKDVLCNIEKEIQKSKMEINKVLTGLMENENNVIIEPPKKRARLSDSDQNNTPTK